MTRSKKSKSQSSSSRAAPSKSSLSFETTKENQNLGDFGGLWLFLKCEKEKWHSPNISSDIESILTNQSIESETKQPPLLPHSSSSEYSSEEETEPKVHKAVQQSSTKKVEGIVTVSKGKGSSNKKKGKKTASTNESKAEVTVRYLYFIFWFCKIIIY